MLLQSPMNMYSMCYEYENSIFDVAVDVYFVFTNIALCIPVQKQTKKKTNKITNSKKSSQHIFRFYDEIIQFDLTWKWIWIWICVSGTHTITIIFDIRLYILYMCCYAYHHTHIRK